MYSGSESFSQLEKYWFIELMLVFLNMTLTSRLGTTILKMIVTKTKAAKFTLSHSLPRSLIPQTFS